MVAKLEEIMLILVFIPIVIRWLILGHICVKNLLILSTLCCKYLGFFAGTIFAIRRL